MTNSFLSLPLARWPEIDRELWRLAQEPAGFLEDDRPASRWSPDYRSMIEQGYGRWLAFLERQDALDPSCAPGERANEDRLRAFIAELQGRVAPVSVSLATGALLRMLVVIAPERDWTTLAQAYRHFKRTARPSRDKRARMVAASDLFALGIRLMETCADGAQHAIYAATKYRDGLMIALLIACPMRFKNLAGLIVGRHLVFDGREYRIELSAAETKTGRPYHAAVPEELTPYIDRYLRVHRPALCSMLWGGSDAKSTSGRLWVGRLGIPLSGAGVRRQIEVRTRAAFGHVVWPHLFRDCAVSELVDCAPEEIGIAPDLLGHADLKTTRKHYIQATGMRAHARIQEMIAARRRAAISRDTADR